MCILIHYYKALCYVAVITFPDPKLAFGEADLSYHERGAGWDEAMAQWPT